MHISLFNWVLDLRYKIPFDAGKTLEIGSQDLNGSIRPCFGDAISYFGTDQIAGKGVDIVLPNDRLYGFFGKESFDTIISCECLEHDIDFLGTVDAIHKMLRPNGLLLISTPSFGFPYNALGSYNDYWRFSRDTFENVFFKDMDILAIDEINCGPHVDLVWPTLCCLGRKK